MPHPPWPPGWCSAAVTAAAPAAAAGAPTLDGGARTYYSPRPKPTILSAVTGSKDFTLLAAAVKAAGLAPTLGDPSASLTVFAPNNEAFLALAKTLGWKGGSNAAALKFILDALRTLSKGADPAPLLATILKFHVTKGAVKAKALVAAGGYTPLVGPRVKLGADGKTLIDAAPAVADAKLLSTDTVVSNGVVHVISRVLLPLAVGGKAPAAKPEAPKPTQTIAQLASGTPDLSILVKALAAADLVGVVANAKASLTVFAPTNAAFLALARTLGYRSKEMDGVFPFLVKQLTAMGKGDPVPLLKAILTYHVLPTRKGAVDLLGRGPQKTVQGGQLRVTRKGVVVDLASFVANGKITTADVAATNGVVHLVSRVLLPIPVCPAPASRLCAALGRRLDAKNCRCARRRRYSKGY